MFELVDSGPQSAIHPRCRWWWITKDSVLVPNPEIGRQAALEDRDRIARRTLSGGQMAFITAGMGGGTGTGAAEIARELEILTVAVVTKPFRFEKRTDVADAGIAQCRASSIP